MNQQLLRKLPKIDDLLRSSALEQLREEYPEQTIADGARQVIADLRAGIMDGSDRKSVV